MRVPRKVKLVAGGLLLALSVLGVWALWIEPASLTVRHVALRVPRWRAEHDNFKLAVLTDLHVGAPHMKLEQLRRVVSRTNDEAPDAVVILGDLVIHEVVGGRFVEP